MHSIIPKLDDTYPLLVDANGQLVTGKPRPGTFAARMPQPFHFGGTIPPKRLMPGQKRPDFSNPKVQRRLAKLNQSNLAALERAVFDLSQRPIGIERLQNAAKIGATIFFNEDRLRSIGAGAAADRAPFLVMLGKIKPYKTFCHYLMHELGHLGHFVYGLYRKPSHGLEAAMKVDFAMEGAARTDQALLAYQCEYDDRHRQDIYRPAGMIAAFSKRYPIMGMAAVENTALALKSDWRAFCSKIFESYLDEYGTRIFYQKKLFEDTAKVAFEHQDNPNLMTKVLTGAAIAPRIRIGNKPYVDPAVVDYEDVVTLGPDETVERAYEKFLRTLGPLNAAKGGTMQLSVSRSYVDIVVHDLSLDSIERDVTDAYKNLQFLSPISKKLIVLDQ